MPMGGFGSGFSGGMPMNGPMGMIPMTNDGNFNGMNNGMGNNGGFDNGPYSPYNGKRK